MGQQAYYKRIARIVTVEVIRTLPSGLKLYRVEGQEDAIETELVFNVKK